MRLAGVLGAVPSVLFLSISAVVQPQLSVAAEPLTSVIEHRSGDFIALLADDPPGRTGRSGHGGSRGSPGRPGGHERHRSERHRDFHGRAFIGVGPLFSWGAYRWYSPGYVYEPPAVAVEPPPVYIERPPVPPQPYWYYCPSTRAYYPSVRTCDEPWVPVPDRAP